MYLHFYIILVNIVSLLFLAIDYDRDLIEIKENNKKAKSDISRGDDWKEF